MGERLLWPELEPTAIDEGWLVEVPPLTSSQVLDAISRRHSMDGFNGRPGRWVFVREVQAATGSYADVQRFDAVAIGLVPSVKYARVVYEVKVSRSDWLRELRPMAMVHDRWGDRLIGGQRAAVLLNADGLPEYRISEARKWDAALAVSTELWFAAPPRCILPSEVPDDAGLIEVRLWGARREPRAKVIRAAPVRATPVPDAGFWAAVLRKAAERNA